MFDISPLAIFVVDVGDDRLDGFVDADSDQTNLAVPLLLVALSHCLVVCHRLLARRAPGRPEIDQPHLALHMCQNSRLDNVTDFEHLGDRLKLGTDAESGGDSHLNLVATDQFLVFLFECIYNLLPFEAEITGDLEEHPLGNSLLVKRTDRLADTHNFAVGQRRSVEMASYFSENVCALINRELLDVWC